ncbi:YlaF family protein [Aneurinibacillus sp. REN35]|uniref:YlaF family protein n=1 Tax=Aneurinibacillus sp. REN35 TaxID=3237286 RepID=UPI0035291DE6
MTKYQMQSLVLSVLAVICLVGVGIAVGERNALLAVGFLVAALFISGFGFMLKSKRRKDGTL